MKLLALHLTNVRKFTGKRASITGIGDGITVISEANEFGKSTFFDAIHALFFEKYSSSAKQVKSLQPYAGGTVQIAADVKTDSGTFRVEKRFLSKKSAKVSRMPEGTTIAQDDEAERWISTLLGTATDGPAGLLWVRQGLLGLEADNAKEKSQLMETRRDLLSSVAGEIDTMTGGRRMDRVMRSVADSLAEITTKTGRKSGAWKTATDKADAVEAELIAVTAQVQTLENALNERKRADASLKRLNNPEAKARRNDALVAAKAAMEKARTHLAAVKTAQQECDLTKLKAKSAQGDLDGYLKVLDTLKTIQKRAQNIDAQLDEVKADGARSKGILTTAQQHHAAALVTVGDARKNLDQTRQQFAARKAKAEAGQLGEQIAKAESALRDRDIARTATKGSLATAAWLQTVENAHADVLHLSTTLDAQATRLKVDYDGDARITKKDGPLAPNQSVVLDGETALDLPGIGKMTIYANAIGGEGKSRLATAQTALKNALTQAGALTLNDARNLTATRTKNEAKAKLAQAVLETLAPNGLQDLQSAKAYSDLAANTAHADDIPTIVSLEAQVMELEEAETQSRHLLKIAEADHLSAREKSAKVDATADASKLLLEQAEAAAGLIEARETRRADLLRAQAQEQSAMVKVEADLQAVIAAAPDFDTAEAELKRAEDAVGANRQERANIGEQLAGLSSQIRTLAGNGIEERRDEMAGELETLRLSQARFAKNAAALTRLQTALDAERDAARDTYFGPVQEELKPLLSILHRDAVLNFDSESLLPTGLMRDAQDETLEDLSGGTKEQIAILTRLAFARLFARKGRHMPIILDDALVYSDDDRIVKMFTALTRVAQDQQIIVFSCRQLAFQDLGGTRPHVEITDV